MTDVVKVQFSDTNAGGQARYPGAAAYAAACLGFRIFPLTPTGTPAVSSWPEVATTDLSVISDWFTGEFRSAGYGIACGPESDIWVLDVDTKHGVDGYLSLGALLRANNAQRQLLNTMSVRTPSGGAHVYFRWAEGVVNSTSARNDLGPGLDVRADRGYVRGPGWGGYAVVPRDGVRSVAIASAPDWLVAKCQQRYPERRAENKVQASGGRYGVGIDPERVLRRLEYAMPGTRNDALNKAAWLLAKSGKVTLEDAWHECSAIMNSIGANDDMRTQRRTFESGWYKGLAARSNDNEQEVTT